MIKRISLFLMFECLWNSRGKEHHHGHHYLQKVAKSTYSKALPCLFSSWMMAGKNQSEFLFPDDAETHYLEILQKTERFRSMPVHQYANYEGPWVENIFIANFSKYPLSHFNGFIPIFVQWIDTQILRGRHFDNILHTLNGVLRPNVLYLAVSQGDVGLGKIGTSHPNILVLSAGGFGHVVIPLIRSEIAWLDPPTDSKYEQDVGFFGNANQHQSTRPAMLTIVKDELKKVGLSYKQGQGDTWQHDMAMTKFNLAPRGYGRSSFRFAESIQMGRVPVWLYDDFPWIPYLGTNCSVENFGFRGGYWDHNNSLVDVVGKMKNITEVEYQKKLEYLKSVREFFTYEGLFGQIELFLKDPFGVNGGNLVCATHPKSERCCG